LYLPDDAGQVFLARDISLKWLDDTGVLLRLSSSAPGFL
jgi:hypothetical protein